MVETKVTELSTVELDGLLLDVDDSSELLSDTSIQDTIAEADFNQNATISTISSAQQLEEKTSVESELSPVSSEISRTDFLFPFSFIVGTNQADELAGTSKADIILGLAGDDFLVGLGGNDIIVGGDGDDTIFGNSGNDVITGSNGNDEQFGNSGNDRIIGGAGSDVLDGADGTDTADYSSLGRAITLERAGAINKGSLGTDQILGIERIVGASGKSNAIDGSTGTSGVTSFTIDLDDDRLTVNDIPVLGDVTFTVENFVNVTGTTQADYIAGNAQNNRFRGGSGNDRLFGRNGNDYLFGDSGNDFLDGGSGNDFLNGGSGADTLVGGSGSDTLVGGSNGDLFELSLNDLFVDRIVDFNFREGDRIGFSFFGSGYTTVSYEQFDFDSGTGALSFDGQQVASLGSSTDFDLESNLIVTDAKLVTSPEQPVLLEPTTLGDNELA